MFPLILITVGRSLKDQNEVKLNLYENYAEAIELSGGIPVIAGAFSDHSIKQYAEIADGLVVSGGEDLNPKCYGKEKQLYCEEPDDWRDRYELSLVEEFSKRGKPIFGICRGLQLINVYFGGTLFQDLEEELGEIHQSDMSHSIVTTSSSLISEMFGEAFRVNSYHHQAIENLGDGLLPIAFTDDLKIIEAICHEGLPIIAVQWHPERMIGNNRNKEDDEPGMQPLFRWFVEKCISNKAVDK